MAIKTFRDLEVWQLSMEMVESVYRVTAALPDHERYGLTSQTRRAAVSIPANIAEGKNRRLEKPYRNHVNIALGSPGRNRHTARTRHAPEVPASISSRRGE